MELKRDGNIAAEIEHDRQEGRKLIEAIADRKAEGLDTAALESSLKGIRTQLADMGASL